MNTRTATRKVLARRAWGLMFDFIMRTSAERMRVLQEHGLTPNDSRGLTGLDPVNGRTMHALAAEWQCDASNATWIVDRLQRLRLAKRLTTASDRRVKLVVLTPHGVAVRKQLLETFHQPPAAMLALSHAELERLHRGLEVLADAESARSFATRRTS